jgi:hypothetical protein
MDLRIDRVRASLIQKIKNSDDLEKLDKMLLAFDESKMEEAVPMTRDLYLERTQEGLRSAKEDRRYSSEEVRRHFGIRERR